MRRTAVFVSAMCALAGCSTGASRSATTSSASAVASDAMGTTSVPTSDPATASAAPNDPTVAQDPIAACVQNYLVSMTPGQKAAQLVLVALTPDTVSVVSKQISDGYAGGVFLLGGWHDGVEVTAQTMAKIHALATSTAGVAPWIAIDQEGGEVQQLKGPGASSIPSAVEQGKLDPAALRQQAAQWASELNAAGIDINLAPVADVVPPELGVANAPIGKFQREYGSTPESVSPASIAFMNGMRDGDVLPTVKHFPGIGRLTANTDVSATNISDPTMTTTDPYLQPFQDAIAQGAPIVMVSTALYPGIDPANQATFSPTIVDGLLRTQMGFQGVVMTDDVGAAKSVADVPVGDRITRFVAAGGDVVLTAEPTQADDMNKAVTAKYAADPQFAAKVDAAAARVLLLKAQHGSVSCS